MKKNAFFIITLILFSVTVMVLLRSAADGSDTTETKINQDVPGQTRNCFVDLPKPFDFAGEEVPIAEQEVFERLDREIHINTYYHSSTIQIIKLANRWFPVMREILRENDIPEDFVYLAAAESGLRNVVSPAGARGVWQILTSTGREYGLNIDNYVDERYHVEKATEAACKYLQKAYDKFGSWTLAAAAYNRGMNGIENELEEQKVNNYYDLYLNTETSRYVFRILALKAILTNPSNYGFCYDQNDLYQIEKVKMVTVDSSIGDLVEFAKKNGTTYKMVKHLNPWLRDESLIIRGGSEYKIKLPA